MKTVLAFPTLAADIWFSISGCRYMVAAQSAIIPNSITRTVHQYTVGMVSKKMLHICYIYITISGPWKYREHKLTGLIGRMLKFQIVHLKSIRRRKSKYCLQPVLCYWTAFDWWSGSDLMQPIPNCMYNSRCKILPYFSLFSSNILIKWTILTQ